MLLYVIDSTSEATLLTVNTTTAEWIPQTTEQGHRVAYLRVTAMDIQGALIKPDNNHERVFQKIQSYDTKARKVRIEGSRKGVDEAIFVRMSRYSDEQFEQLTNYMVSSPQEALAA